MSNFDKDRFEQCFYYFKSFVETYSGGHFNGFKNNYFLKKEEGYKYKVFETAHNSLKLDSWKEEHIGTGYIANCFKDAYKQKGNLVFYRSDNKTELQINENVKETETLLYNLYLKDEDAKSFEKAVKIFGGRYDLIAYLFFIKDKNKYLPISPKRFEQAFNLFGIDIKLQYNCSWGNYSKYINLIEQIKEEFEDCCGIKINLLDAHSFVWMVNQAKDHFITKDLWLTILKDDTLLKPNDITILKDFYKAPKHTSTCSEMSDKTGVPVSAYNQAMGNAGKRISNALKFLPNYRENGTQRYWSVLFRGHYREDGLFEWQVKPELVKALEIAYPELRLDLKLIETIKKDKKALTNEIEADNEAHLELSSNDNVTKSDFKEFVGIPREKPELVETKLGKRYKRDKQRSINALHRANYLCEYNPKHETFLRKSVNVNYTESHHLVPMAFQDCFPNATLDTESNIVSLCSNCHNQVHYGQGAELIITELYNQRKDVLEKEGIVITLEQLLSMYK